MLSFTQPNLKLHGYDGGEWRPSLIITKKGLERVLAINSTCTLPKNWTNTWRPQLAVTPVGKLPPLRISVIIRYLCDVQSYSLTCRQATHIHKNNVNILMELVDVSKSVGRIHSGMLVIKCHHWTKELKQNYMICLDFRCHHYLHSFAPDYPPPSLFCYPLD